MRGLRLAILPVWLLACSASPAGDAEPRRIVSTAPSITEMLYALGLGSRVVGDTEFCRYPPEARDKPHIGTFLEPDFERILALKPDLVLVIKNPVQLTERLRKLGLRTEELNQDSISDILNSLQTLGRLTGKRAEATKLAANLRSELDAVRRSVAGKPKRTTLFLVGRSPSALQGMVGVGPHTFIDELLAIAGGDNVLKGSPIPYPKVSMEQLMAANPEVILDMGNFAHAEGRPAQPEAVILALWARYPQLRAVRTHEVRVVDSDAFVRPGPRMAEAAQRFQRLLHGSPAR